MSAKTIPSQYKGFNNKNLKVQLTDFNSTSFDCKIYDENSNFITDDTCHNINLLQKGWDKNWFLKEKVVFLESDGVCYLGKYFTPRLKLIPGHTYENKNQFKCLYLGCYDGIRMFVDPKRQKNCYLKFKPKSLTTDEYVPNYHSIAISSLERNLIQNQHYFKFNTEMYIWKAPDSTCYIDFDNGIINYNQGYKYIFKPHKKPFNEIPQYIGFLATTYITTYDKEIPYIVVKPGFHKNKKEVQRIKDFLNS